MKIKRPKQIPVGGHLYEVRLDPQLRPREGLLGFHSNWEKAIAIDSNQLPGNMTYTLIDEIMHAINLIYLDNSLTDRDLHGISQGLHQVLGALGIEIDWEE